METAAGLTLVPGHSSPPGQADRECAAAPTSTHGGTDGTARTHCGHSSRSALSPSSPPHLPPFRPSPPPLSRPHRCRLVHSVPAQLSSQPPVRHWDFSGPYFCQVQAQMSSPPYTWHHLAQLPSKHDTPDKILETYILNNLGFPSMCCIAVLSCMTSYANERIVPTSSL